MREHFRVITAEKKEKESPLVSMFGVNTLLIFLTVCVTFWMFFVSRDAWVLLGICIALFVVIFGLVVWVVVREHRRDHWQYYYLDQELMKSVSAWVLVQRWESGLTTPWEIVRWEPCDEGLVLRNPSYQGYEWSHVCVPWSVAAPGFSIKGIVFLHDFLGWVDVMVGAQATSAHERFDLLALAQPWEEVLSSQKNQAFA